MSAQEIRSLRSIVEEGLTYQNLSKRERPLKTGFPRLDAVLEGGLTPGLIVLGAGPGQGKSTVSLQIAEYVSRVEKVPVLYFSLEMSQERIAAKATAMDNFRQAKSQGLTQDCLKSGKKARERFFTAAELFNPEKLENMPEEKRQQLEQARQRVAQNENLHISDQPFCVREITQIVGKFIEEQEAQAAEDGTTPRKPLVIIDYLQILPPDPEKRAPATDKQQVDLNLKGFRELVLQGLPVLLISSLKRGNYSGKEIGPMEMDSFKETGGIEYSADVLIGLQFAACHNQGGCNPDEEKVKYPRDMELVVLKQRYGAVNAGVPVWYYAEFDYLEEKPEEKQEVVTEEAEAPDTAQEKKPTLVPQETAYMNNTLVANEIRKGNWRSGQERRCNVASRGNSAVYTTFTLEGDLTYFDMDVADAVYSLYRNGNKEFLLRHVLRALTGDENQTLTEGKKDQLKESLARLRAAKITINCTDQMLKMKKKPELLAGGKVVIAGSFLSLREENGKYSFADSGAPGAMPLYYYGELIQQMIAFPLCLLGIHPRGVAKVSDTKDNIMIKRYLIRRLEVLRNGRASGPHMRRITYFNRMMGEDSGMLVAMTEKRDKSGSGAPAPSLAKLRRTHKTVTQILSNFQQCGYIDGFEEKGTEGVEILEQVHNPYMLEREE